ncbi:2',3'-cyclic-nucleotide 2'-phosphodiesterase [Cutibacterium acnes JCM 18920]|nr:2',3'-cyclic-nucleotide 2'-phosphodiesterase [Cutibacterium acnes JCM 18920]
MTIPLNFSATKVTIRHDQITVKPRYTRDVKEDTEFASDSQLQTDHKATVRYVNSVVATSMATLTTERSMVEDTPILDFIGKVEADTVAKAIKGGTYDGIPVIAQVSPFSRTAAFPKGDVTIKDIAGLYVFDNTLAGILLTGKQLEDYLEYSAKYFKQAKKGAAVNPAPASEGGDTQADYQASRYGITTMMPLLGSRTPSIFPGRSARASWACRGRVSRSLMTRGSCWPSITTA